MLGVVHNSALFIKRWPWSSHSRPTFDGRFFSGKPGAGFPERNSLFWAIDGEKIRQSNLGWAKKGRAKSRQRDWFSCGWLTNGLRQANVDFFFLQKVPIGFLRLLDTRSCQMRFLSLTARAITNWMDPEQYSSASQLKDLSTKPSLYSGPSSPGKGRKCRNTISWCAILFVEYQKYDTSLPGTA